MRGVCQENTPICAFLISQTSLLHHQSVGCQKLSRCGNTFSFNPSWPTSWWTWPQAWRITTSSRQRRQERGSSNMSPSSLSPPQWLRMGEHSPAHPVPWDRLYWKVGKTEAKMLAAVMCVERNAPLLSLTELCKNGSVETFAWYSVGPRPPYAQAKRTLSGMLIPTHTHTLTHTQSQADPALKIL